MISPATWVLIRWAVHLEGKQASPVGGFAEDSAWKVVYHRPHDGLWQSASESGDDAIRIIAGVLADDGRVADVSLHSDLELKPVLAEHDNLPCLTQANILPDDRSAILTAVANMRHKSRVRGLPLNYSPHEEFAILRWDAETPYVAVAGANFTVGDLCRAWRELEISDTELARIAERAECIDDACLIWEHESWWRD